MARGGTKWNLDKTATPKQTAAMVAKKAQAKTISELPRPIKIAATKGLRDLDYSLRKISKIMNITTDTAMDYLNTEIDDKFLQYSDAVSKIFKEEDDTLRILASNAAKHKLKDVDKVALKDITGLLKVLKEGEGGTNSQKGLNQSIIAINVHPAFGERKKTYDIEDGEVVKE